MQINLFLNLLHENEATEKTILPSYKSKPILTDV